MRLGSVPTDFLGINKSDIHGLKLLHVVKMMKLSSGCGKRKHPCLPHPCWVLWFSVITINNYLTATYLFNSTLWYVLQLIRREDYKYYLEKYLYGFPTLGLHPCSYKRRLRKQEKYPPWWCYSWEKEQQFEEERHWDEKRYPVTWRLGRLKERPARQKFCMMWIAEKKMAEELHCI